MDRDLHCLCFFLLDVFVFNYVYVWVFVNTSPWVQHLWSEQDTLFSGAEVRGGWQLLDVGGLDAIAICNTVQKMTDSKYKIVHLLPDS